MTSQFLQTLSQVAIVIGAIIFALGGFGSYYFGKQIEKEQEADTQIKARDSFLRSLHFRHLNGYWVEIWPDVYQLGLAATVLNKDATRALVFDGVGFEGGFNITAESGGFHLKSMALYNARAIVQGQYYLSPSKETVIYMLLPSKVEMQIMAGGKPGLRFNGSWTFVFEGTPFTVSSPAVAMLDVLSLAEWKRRSGES